MIMSILRRVSCRAALLMVAAVQVAGAAEPPPGPALEGAVDPALRRIASLLTLNLVEATPVCQRKAQGRKLPCAPIGITPGSDGSSPFPVIFFVANLDPVHCPTRARQAPVFAQRTAFDVS